MMKLIITGFIIVVSLALVIFVLLYFVQERLIFFPEKLPANHQFSFTGAFEEIIFDAEDKTKLHAVLFKSHKPSAGVIFYLHGNAGTIDTWGYLAGFYNQLGYDVFMLDYRGYGKSGGHIKSEKQFFSDVDIAYAELTKKYKEDMIVVLGYSIGTGAAARVAATHQPRLLILQAPYYSLTDLIQKLYPVVPRVFVKYRFNTAAYIRRCRMPVFIFHGDRDEIIYYQSSLKLQQLFKKSDSLFILPNQVHNGITENLEYQEHIKRILTH